MLKSERIIPGLLLASVLFVAVLVVGCGGEGQDPAVITMEGRVIALSEIAEEFNRIHGTGQWENSDFEARQEFAEIVMKKELLVRRARELYGNTLAGREKLIFDRWLEKQAIQRYWPRERAAIPIPPHIIDSLTAVMSEERYLRHIACRYEEDGLEIYEKIQSGADFAEIGSEYEERNPETVRILEPGWLDRPSLPPEIGNALFGLESPGQIAPLCETERYGWNIVLLDSIRPTDPSELPTRVDQAADRDYRRRVISQRIQKLKDRYAMELVEENVGPIQKRFEAMHDSMNAAMKAGVRVQYQALPPPMHRFSPEERALPLIRWSGGVFTIEDFVNSLALIDLDYWPTAGPEDRIGPQITRRMTRWILMEEAKAGGILEDPVFTSDVQRKEEELFLDRFHEEYIAAYGDAVTDADVLVYWEKNPDEYRSRDLVGYGFMRFPSESEDLARRTYEQLQGGTQWAMAAHNARETDSRVEFEAGIDPTDGPPYPDVTQLALQYDLGPDGMPVVTEPLELDGEWVILNVHFRRHPETMDFESAEPFVRRQLQQSALEDTLTAIVGRLQDGWGATIDIEALR